MLSLKAKSPTMATLFTNRALCFLKLKKWDLAATDCRRALEIDSRIVKGYYFLGQALLEQQFYDESIKSLQKGRQNIDNLVHHQVLTESITAQGIPM
jgi:tetratricopeptide (TPR) repeat protein